ncbi:MAG TPA: MarR family transcriptional regulator [Solirubrobacteraceae bacterium]|jgi:DNA-binding MarR family transcriptional regulator
MAVKIALEATPEYVEPVEYPQGTPASKVAGLANLAPCADDDAIGSNGAKERELDEHELRAWRGLLRAHASLAKLLDAELESQHGLPMTSYEVLSQLEVSDQGRMRMCDLAEQAQMSRSGLTRLVDRLEREGLLERCSCEHDARGAYACLTAAGRERLCAARSTHRGVVREHFLSLFSEQELGTLAELWERIAAPCRCC